jgi:hypothetical protein
LQDIINIDSGKPPVTLQNVKQNRGYPHFLWVTLCNVCHKQSDSGAVTGISFGCAKNNQLKTGCEPITYEGRSDVRAVVYGLHTTRYVQVTIVNKVTLYGINEALIVAFSSKMSAFTLMAYEYRSPPMAVHTALTPAIKAEAIFWPSPYSIRVFSA